MLVVGAGPAGLAAAACAAECGRQVGLVDDNPRPGGQIWRSEGGKVALEARHWEQRLRAAGAEILCGTRVFHQPEPGVLLAESEDQSFELSYRKLVLSTGARERFLPFPGWTLPNVMGAGGLQALVKSGLAVQGKRVVVAGSGPLLLAVAAYLKRHGANVLTICEQASLVSLARFGFALLYQPHKIAEGISLRRQLSGIPYALHSWVIGTGGKQQLESVTISHNGRLETVACDYLACGFHLVPNTELAALLGCRFKQDLVDVDALQQTSVEGVFCAGEPTGIGGLELSLLEGQIAGFATADHFDKAQRLFGARQKLRRFSQAMDQAFALRAELKNLPLPDTIVCRCEDVALGRASQHTSWRAAKLHTRCGMGPCQGRICGPATQFLLGWRPDSVRPPIFPTRFSSISVLAGSEAQSGQNTTGGN